MVLKNKGTRILPRRALTKGSGPAHLLAREDGVGKFVYADGLCGSELPCCSSKDQQAGKNTNERLLRTGTCDHSEPTKERQSSLAIVASTLRDLLGV